jgi:RNA polymerase sigma factor (TIGR02999 family)
MGEPLPDQITLLLEKMQVGDDDARAQLVSLVYPQLKKLAAHQMRGERSDHTLQPTALVNEVFLRLAGGAEIAWQSRNHFFALSAALMRQILVDHARRRRAAKRGAGTTSIEIQEWHAQLHDRPEVVLEVDKLITRLNSLDSRQAKVVEMRYFAGLSEGEIAEVLGISERTVKRDWNMARAWMRKELSA